MTSDHDIESRLRRLTDTDPLPAAAEAELETILARRARGERVALPIEPPRSGRSIRWIAAGLAAAAVVAVAVLTEPTSPAQRTSRFRPPPLADTVPLTDGMGGLLFPAPLLAQATREPRYAPVEPEQGERLRPGRWFYTSPMLGRQFQPQDTAIGFAIERTVWESRAAWLILGGRRFPSGAVDWGRDSLWLTWDSLRPLREVKRIGESTRIEKTWREQEVLIGETVSGFTSWRNRPIIDPLRNPAEGIPVHWYQFVATIQSGKLSPGWRRSLEMPFLVREGPGWGYYLNLEVVREESVTVPAGRFDCWKVVIGREDNGHQIWVEKQRGWIVAQSTVWGGRDRYRQELVAGQDLP